MTEWDFRVFKRMMWMYPIISVIAILLIQWGTLQANSSNVQKQIIEQKAECEKRFEKIEREKADVDVVGSKFDNIDWKLDLIMKNLGVINAKRPVKDSL